MDWQGLPVLVTGASGFIGSHLTRVLVNLGAQVNVFVYPGNSLWRLSDVISKVKVFEVNLVDSANTKKAVGQVRPDKVFHLAAKVDVNRSFELLSQMMSINFQGTVNLIVALRGMPISCFINTGSSEEYGTNEAPFVETMRERPVSPYSFSKLAATQYCQMLYRTEAFPSITLRPFLTYGPYQTGSMLVPSLIKSCLVGGELPMTAGEQTREFNYVADVVAGYVKVATCEQAIGEVINLGNGIESQIKEAVSMIVKATGNKAKPLLGALPYRPGEVMHFYCSPQKALDLTGWKPKVGLKEGLEKTVAWYKEWQGKN